MILLTNLMISFTCSFCDLGSSAEEAPYTQASIIQQAEPGLIAVYDSAKQVIKE